MCLVVPRTASCGQRRPAEACLRGCQRGTQVGVQSGSWLRTHAGHNLGQQSLDEDLGAAGQRRERADPLPAPPPTTHHEGDANGRLHNGLAAEECPECRILQVNSNGRRQRKALLPLGSIS